MQARDNSRGVDNNYKNWYLDLNDLGVELSKSSNSQLKTSGQAIQAGIDKAVINAYGNNPYSWTGGLTVMFDVEYSLFYLNEYAKGTWAQATKWDDLLLWLYNN